MSTKGVVAQGSTRRPPQETYNSPNESKPLQTHNDGSVSPIISNFRLSNPNLQPLSESEQKELTRSRVNRTKRYSSNTLPTPPSSTDTDLAHTRHSIGSVNDLKSKLSFHRTSVEFSRKVSPSVPSEQSFWKYHILEIGQGLYLTTNPDPKHLYSRNAPGIQVEIVFPKNPKGIVETSGKDGFRMVFKSQLDGSDFMTLTKKADDNGGEIHLQSYRLFQRDDEGLLNALTDDIGHQDLKANLIEIAELKNKYFEEASFKPFRYGTKDTNGVKWNIGSIPRFKTPTKLKNKRYVYFHSFELDKILACYRPNELRKKKKIIKKLNIAIQAKSVERGEIETHYTTFGDGITVQDPPDDSPNDRKLGWITLFDDDILRTPGTLEIILGFTTVAAYAKHLEEKISSASVLS